MKEVRKYLLRFGLLVLLTLPFLYLGGGAKGWQVISYKLALTALGVGLAEGIWIVWYKPYYGRTEDLRGADQFNILVFRVGLVAAIILALNLGL